jgi:hypothetical protein
MKHLIPDYFNFLIPVAIQDPVRIGNNEDGGYLVPRAIVDRSEGLLGLGLGDNYTFEEDYRKLKPTAPIHLYDGTVDGNKWAEPRRSKYIEFFNDAVHHRENIDKNNIVKALDQLGVTNILLKADIEYGEYEIIDDLWANADRIIAIVMEFHGCYKGSEQFKRAVDKFKELYEIVHIHGNNHTGMRDGIHNCMELTFVRRDLVTDVTQRYDYYLPGFDFSNQPGHEDQYGYFETPTN